jgi:hypothetical protein
VFPPPIPPTPSRLGNGDIQLGWPTTTGFRYLVEYSPDLAQWFPIGTPSLATGAP